MADGRIGKRVMVIGGSGAGKTEFSKKLSALTGLPLAHLDRIGWRGHREKTPREEFDALLSEITAGEEWIIDGNWSRTIPDRLKRADTVFWFDFSGIRCLRGVLARFFRNRGKTRDDMGGDFPEVLDGEKLRFFWTALTGAGKIRGRIEEALRDAPHVKVTVFRTRREADGFLEGLSAGEAEEKENGVAGT